MPSAAEPAAERPLRADAERSRRRVLDAAGVLFAEHGLEVGFDQVARAAGVGVGTVYRRFPDREALIDALFAEKIDEVIALAATALGLEDPWSAVVWFLEQSVTMQARDRGLAQLMVSSDRGQAGVADRRGRIEDAVTTLLQRAQRAGQVRDDLVAIDLGLLIHLLGRLSADDQPDLWRRYLTLLLESLRPRVEGNLPLTVPAPSVEVFEQVMGR